MSVNVALGVKLIALPPGPPGSPAGYLVGAGGPTSGDASAGQILHQYALPQGYAFMPVAFTSGLAAVASANDITGYRFFTGVTARDGVDEFLVGRSSKQEVETTAGVAINSGKTWLGPRVLFVPDEGGTAPFVDCFGTNGGASASFVSSIRLLIWDPQVARNTPLSEILRFL